MGNKPKQPVEQPAKGILDSCPGGDKRQHLEEIREAVQDGTYQVDPTRLAKVLIDRHTVRKANSSARAASKT